MNRLVYVVALILIAGILFTGCTNQTGKDKQEKQNPEESNAGSLPEQKENSSPDEVTVSQERIALNSTREIYLTENPTTGYTWNVTVSTGLKIETDEYVADPVRPGIVGSGGTHHWVIRANLKGNQVFDATYKRSWEPTDGNEDRYTLNLIVE